MYRNFEKPYHIDYVFASQELIKGGYNLSLGKKEQWIDKSDHIPLILDIKEFKSNNKIPNTFKDFINRHLSLISSQTKDKYSKEVKMIEDFAEKLDLNINNEGKLELIEKIETLKKIDELALKLKNKLP